LNEKLLDELIVYFTMIVGVHRRSRHQRGYEDTLELRYLRELEQARDIELSK